MKLGTNISNWNTWSSKVIKVLFLFTNNPQKIEVILLIKFEYKLNSD
jgi:hypothetical protein